MPVAHESTEYALQKPTRTNPARLMAPNILSGKVQIGQFHYTTTTGTDEAATDTISICKLPVGSIVIPQLCSCSTLGDVGTSVILDIGQASNVDAFADGIDISAVGVVMWCSGTVPSGASAPEPMLTTDLYATVMTATSPTASVVITFTVAWLPGKG